MAETTRLPPVWVDTEEALRALATDLGRQYRIAVDTESNSLHAYRERVCLIQFSSESCDYLVDALAFDDLSPLAPIFEDANIEKIFHAVEYDIICLHRDYGIVCNNIFDTMVAARTLGYAAVGLGSLLAEKFGVEVNKRYQKADWGQRPLTRDMLEYARLDTHYLIALRDLLAIELIEKKLTAYAAEDFARLGRVIFSNHRDHRTARDRISGARDLTPAQSALLEELCGWREKTSERLDRPPFKVISDDKLLSLAQSAPNDRPGLAEAGLTDLQIERFGTGLLHAIRRGQEAEPIEHRNSPHHRPPESVLRRLDRLRTWRKKTAASMGVDSDIVLPRGHMTAIAEQGPRTPEELRVLMSDLPWRYRHFGEDILRALTI
jgi:ribonuclease D